MKNTIPQINNKLIAQGLTVVAALKTNQAAIGIAHNKDTAMQGALTGFTTAVDAFDVAKEFQRDCFDRQRVAFVTADDWLSGAVNAFIPFLGRTFSAAWATAYGPSLAIPGTYPDRLEALRKVEKQLKDFPDRARMDEDDDAKSVTAARAKDLREALAAAMSAVASCKSDVRTKKGARASAKQALTKRLRGLVNELEQLLPESDPRWSTFGFNAPGETQVPEPVQELELEGDGPGRVQVDWADGARAERFQVEVLVTGVDPEFRRVETVLESETLLALPAGARVRVRIIAVNEAGSSAPSAEAEITVPALADAA